MKKWMIWILAVVITLAAAYYQRTTGPTYPYNTQTEFSGKMISASFPRSHNTGEDCQVKIEVPENSISASMIYRLYPSSAKWDTLPMQREGNLLVVSLPAQPPAGKLAYRVLLSDGAKKVLMPAGDPVVIRFKGAVPSYILIPHVFFMFFAMLLSSVAGLMAIWKKPEYKKYAILTLIFLFIGGGILGPIVQKYAFGELWTGIPFGWDLTDNKTLIALVFWIVAVLLNVKQKRYAWVVVAAVVLLLIYSIPHSMFGSEFNYETGKITQGLLLPVFWFGKQLSWKKRPEENN